MHLLPELAQYWKKEINKITVNCDIIMIIWTFTPVSIGLPKMKMQCTLGVGAHTPTSAFVCGTHKFTTEKAEG